MTADEVESRLREAGFELKRRDRLSNDMGEQLRFTGGEVVLVYDSGKVVVQGKNPDAVGAALESADVVGASRPQRGGASRNVFVVYGHDVQAKTELEAMLRRWDLNPLILDQLPSEGATVVEKLEKYTGNDVSFAVVLATPDDIGYSAGKEDESRFRARQNVILELGLLLGKVSRPRVAILLKKQELMERPSDIQGLLYIPFSDSVEEAKVQLAKEMQKAGLRIEVAKL
jgi:predicted nucleotide-binding protein